VVYANAVGQEILNHTTTSYGGLSTVASPSAELTQAGFNPQLLVKKIEKEQVLQRKSNSHIKDQRLEIYQ
jgi:hypothetical protein